MLCVTPPLTDDSSKHISRPPFVGAPMPLAAAQVLPPLVEYSSPPEPYRPTATMLGFCGSTTIRLFWLRKLSLVGHVVDTVQPGKFVSVQVSLGVALNACKRFVVAYRLPRYMT